MHLWFWLFAVFTLPLGYYVVEKWPREEAWTVAWITVVVGINLFALPGLVACVVSFMLGRELHERAWLWELQKDAYERGTEAANTAAPDEDVVKRHCAQEQRGKGVSE